MKDLTQAEQAELSEELTAFMQDLKLVGLSGVLVVTGRGVTKLAFAKEDGPTTPHLLAVGYKYALEYNARQKH